MTSKLSLMLALLALSGPASARWGLQSGSSCDRGPFCSTVQAVGQVRHLTASMSASYPENLHAGLSGLVPQSLRTGLQDESASAAGELYEDQVSSLDSLVLAM